VPIAAAMDAKQRVPGSGTIVALNPPAVWAVQGKVPSPGETLENATAIPVVPSRLAKPLAKVSVGEPAIIDPADPPVAPDMVAAVNVAVR